jgi:hypothetical protein
MKSGEAVSILKDSVLSEDFISFYRDNALAYPSDPSVAVPEIFSENTSLLFPDWDWILSHDTWITSAKYAAECLQVNN